MTKHNKHKPRTEHIYATTVDVVDNISLSFDPKTFSVRFETDVKDTYSEISYSRKKGPKVISRIPQDDADIQFGQDRTINENYKIVFAVDTNTKIINEKAVSVTGIIQAQKIFAVDNEGLATDTWQFFTPFCIECINIQSSPENLGWMLVIDHIQSTKRFNDFRKIGVIVDSDLDNLKAYNAREKPFFDNFYLPERFHFIYASSDIGRDQFANSMMKFADQASSQCLKALMERGIPLNKEEVKSPYYEGIRHLVPNT